MDARIAYLEQVERIARRLLEVYDSRGSYWYTGDEDDEEVAAWEEVYQSSLERDRALCDLAATLANAPAPDPWRAMPGDVPIKDAL